MRIAISNTQHEFNGYSNLATTLGNIAQYVDQYPNLKHVKVCEEFRGHLLTDDGQFVAILQCNIKTGYIVALEVAPFYRRRGLAEQLLRSAQTEFGCRYLSVNRKNHSAQLLYGKNGYRVIREDSNMLYMEHPIK